MDDFDARVQAEVERRLEAEVTRRLALAAGADAEKDGETAPAAASRSRKKGHKKSHKDDEPGAQDYEEARASFEERLAQKKSAKAKKAARQRVTTSEDGDVATAFPPRRETDGGDAKAEKAMRRCATTIEEGGVATAFPRRKTDGGDGKAKEAKSKPKTAMSSLSSLLSASLRFPVRTAASSHPRQETDGGDDYGDAGAEAPLEERRRRQQEQEEQDKQLKADMRRQREVAREQRGGGKASAEDAFEERRRRQQGQDEKDEKLKQDMRRQRDAAREQRGGGKASAEDGLEERRRRQQGQEKKDEKLKQDMRRQREAAKKQRGAGGGKASAEDGLEERRRRHREQEAKDEKLKEGIRRQREAAREQLALEKETKKDVDAWHEKFSLNKALEMAMRSPQMEWLGSFYRCDPRWQIMKFYDEVAREGGEAPMDEDMAASPLAQLFNKATVFTVWRPTSDEAIKNMMLGIATGKGLDIKGKSAKKGNMSSYVPFIQISEDDHKEDARAFLIDGTVRVFYQSEEDSLDAHEMLLDLKNYMQYAAQDAMEVLSNEYASEEEQLLAMKHLAFDEENMIVQVVNTYINSSPPAFGLDISERLFWQAYAIMQDISRPPGTEWDSGRGSEPNFMKMNWNAVRAVPGPGDPRAVVYQKSKGSPMEPRTLLMAYEEFGKVKPVVSDFDCFLLGSRGVKYKEPIPQDQIKLVKWTVQNVGEVLDERAESDSTEGWMHTWMKVQKKSVLKGYYPSQPKYGYGDPKSYEITEVAVPRLQSTGCVRHGPECFNWWFPQEIDEEFLVVSDTLPGNLKWKKMNVEELQEILIQKIEEGFTFPINPKWVLCDPGWRRVYDTLLASTKPNVQDSVNCWMPPETGLREEIDSISARHPLGFRLKGTCEKVEGTAERDLIEEELERYAKIQRSWRKVRLFLHWIRFLREKRREREEQEALGVNIMSPRFPRTRS